MPSLVEMGTMVICVLGDDHDKRMPRVTEGIKECINEQYICIDINNSPPLETQIQPSMLQGA